MANNDVVLIGRAELDSIYQSLQKVMDHAREGSQEVQQLGNKVNDGMNNQVKKTESGIKRVGSGLRRLASQLYSDFKGLLSLQSLMGGLKLSNQFSGSVKESIKLSDNVRRLGSSFGVAKQEFGFFQAFMARGLGEIGASSEDAANALEGLAGFGVKGVESATSLAKGSVALAGIGGEKGNEKQVSSLLASTLQSQGKDVNDLAAQKALIGEVTAAVTTTGKSASEILGAMNTIFSKMPEELRKKIGPEAMAQLGVVATQAGPDATAGLQKFLSLSKEERMGLEQQGFQNVFDKKGQLDLKQLVATINDIKSRGLSAEASLKTAGFTDEEAQGFVRIAEKADVLAESLGNLSKASRDTDAAYKGTLGMLDAFKANINTVKGYLETAFMGGSQKVTDALSGTIGDPMKSGAVVAGGAALAAVMAGGGLRGLFKMGSSALKGGLQEKAQEALGGENIQPVRIMNWSEMPTDLSGAAGAAGMGGKAGSMLKSAGLVAAAGAAGYAVGSVVEPAATAVLDKYTTGTTDEGYTGNAVERVFAKLDNLLGGKLSGMPPVKIEVESKDPTIRATTKPQRGTSN